MQLRRRRRSAWRRIIYRWPLLLSVAAILALLVEMRLWISMSQGKDDSSQVLPTKTIQLNNDSRRLLGDLKMPTRRVRGRVEPCLKLLDEESIERLELPSYGDNDNEVKKLEYLSVPEYLVPSGVNPFTGNQTMAERDDSFQIAASKAVHCGFYSQNSGFDVDERDQAFLSSCEAVVSTCNFGGGDELYQPIGMTNTSLAKVCYVAFWDEITLAEMPDDLRPDNESRMVGYWRTVLVRNLPFSDQRRNGKIPKMLGHRIFRNAKYSIWVDSKYQFRRDPLAVFEALLWAPNASLAISEHGARRCVYKEGETVVAKHKALPSEVAIQLKQYKSEGFPENATFDGHKALAEASVIVREHSTRTNLFMCLWFNEVVRFTARDQLSFPYVLKRFQVDPQLNMFPVCTRKAMVNSLGHKHKARTAADI